MAAVSWVNVPLLNRQDYTAMNNQNTEQGLLQGLNEQPTVPALYWEGSTAWSRGISIHAEGVISTTSNPTIIFTCRLGTTSGGNQVGGTAVGVSATITTATTITNQWWCLDLDLTCNTPGIGSTNTTLNCTGSVRSPAGFTTPFEYTLAPSTPPTATWTATIDNSVTQYMVINATWGTANASNTITCKYLRYVQWN